MILFDPGVRTLENRRRKYIVVVVVVVVVVVEDRKGDRTVRLYPRGK